LRLLIAEDSALIRKVTCLAFPSAQYELEDAGNGLEALARIEAAAEPFDAIVLDLQMPDMNGVGSSTRSPEGSGIAKRAKRNPPAAWRGCHPEEAVETTGPHRGGPAGMRRWTLALMAKLTTMRLRLPELLPAG
jgi:CheY-like chemotaxis protein